MIYSLCRHHNKVFWVTSFCCLMRMDYFLGTIIMSTGHVDNTQVLMCTLIVAFNAKTSFEPCDVQLAVPMCPIMD